ncbi:hypothetical protein [Rhodovulum strictum]|uniref:STAS domain-containing protein n=1 Tax=Rhodovulum strictum TaxID=58314 RepID=A0A844BKI4_9RHOB|nr:hypothetical protein [Rhodovulum strictum]MRH22125.1 hypothetical protein [Rhodovulum strictum]
MPILIEGEIARITAVVSVEEAETLVAFLEGGANRMVELSGTTHIHAAVLQTLMAYRPAATELPVDQALRALLGRVLAAEPPAMTHAA